MIHDLAQDCKKYVFVSWQTSCFGKKKKKKKKESMYKDRLLLGSWYILYSDAPHNLRPLITIRLRQTRDKVKVICICMLHYK